jgi:hypothetical protein
MEQFKLSYPQALLVMERKTEEIRAVAPFADSLARLEVRLQECTKIMRLAGSI